MSMKKLLATLVFLTSISFPAVLEAQSPNNPVLKETVKTYVEKQGFNLEQTKYRAVEIDLNGDNKKDALVFLVGSYWCGTGGCNMVIFEGVEEGFRLVSEIPLVREPVIVSETSTKGWRDIIVHSSGGGMKAKNVVLKFNGSSYPDNPSMEEAIPLGQKIEGIEVFSEP